MAKNIFVAAMIIGVAMTAFGVTVLVLTLAVETAGYDELQNRSRINVDEATARRTQLNDLLQHCYAGRSTHPRPYCRELVVKLSEDSLLPPSSQR